MSIHRGATLNWDCPLHDEDQRKHTEYEYADRKEGIGEGKGCWLPYQLAVYEAIGPGRGDTFRTEDWCDVAMEYGVGTV